MSITSELNELANERMLA